MPTAYVFAALAAGFLVAAASKRLQQRGHLATRTWLLVGTIFAAVSTWLFFRT